MLPIPTIDELLDELGGANVFTCLGILSGFSNISIHPDTIHLAAVCTQSGLYEWLVMPMGCCGSPGWFQSIMARMCEGLARCRLYIDDICTFRKNGAEHVRDLSSFLDRLTKINPRRAPKKAHLGAGEVTFLGHRILADEVSPDPNSDAAIGVTPRPSEFLASVAC